MVYIHAPVYVSSSNGIRLLYELAYILNKKGIPAKIICLAQEPLEMKLPERYAGMYENFYGKEFECGEGDIAVYNDTTEEDPLKAKHILRWLLNTPYSLNGMGIEYRADELVVAYSTLVSEDLPQLFLMADERELFEKIRSKRRKDRTKSKACLYFGKVHESVINASNARVKRILKDFDEIEIITRATPGSRKDTLNLLANSDLLISFDALTNLNYEAQLLGVPVLMVDDCYDTEHIKFNILQRPIYRYEDYAGSKQTIGDVYAEYVSYLEKQEDTVARAFSSYITELMSFGKNKKAKEANAKKNKAQEAADLEKFEKKQTAEPFTNINWVQEVPRSAISFLRPVKKKLKISVRNELNLVGFLTRIKNRLYHWYHIPDQIDNHYAIYMNRFNELCDLNLKLEREIQELKEELNRINSKSE